MTSDAAAAFGAPDERKRGSALGYWVAGLLGLAAVGGAIAWFIAGFAGLGDAVHDLQRVEIPGTAVVMLEAGKNAVYLEGSGSARSVQITLREVGGPAVEVGPHSGDTTYHAGGHEGRSVAGFTIQRAGRYELSVDGSGGVLAVGKGVGGRIVKTVAGGLGVLFGGLLLCGLAIILTARRR